MGRCYIIDCIISWCVHKLVLVKLLPTCNIEVRICAGNVQEDALVELVEIYVQSMVFCQKFKIRIQSERVCQEGHNGANFSFVYSAFLVRSY